SAALSSVPSDVYESAAIDGAGPLRRFWSVTVPILRPAIATNLMLITLQTLSVFGLIFIMTGGGPAQASQTLPLYMYEQAFSYGQLGYGTAVALLLLLIGGSPRCCTCGCSPRRRSDDCHSRDHERRQLPPPRTVPATGPDVPPLPEGPAGTHRHRRQRGGDGDHRRRIPGPPALGGAGLLRHRGLALGCAARHVEPGQLRGDLEHRD